MNFKRYKESTVNDINLLDIPYDGFSGHVAPVTAFEVVSTPQTETAQAVIIDVRTVAEWQFIGLPDLSPERFFKIEWQSYPTMGLNEHFGSTLMQCVPDKATPVFMLCRSGARSMSAAQQANALGYELAFNIAGGFEGDVDGKGHRGTVNGWKADGLPWRQM